MKMQHSNYGQLDTFSIAFLSLVISRVMLLERIARAEEMTVREHFHLVLSCRIGVGKMKVPWPQSSPDSNLPTVYTQ